MFKPIYSTVEVARLIRRHTDFVNKLADMKYLQRRKQGRSSLFYGKDVEKLCDNIFHPDFPNNIENPKLREFLFQEYSEKAKDKVFGRKKGASKVLAEISSN